MRLVLLGPPGAGKGTQGGALARRYGVPHIASGDIVRDHIAARTVFGRKIEAAIAAGNFASDKDIVYWVGRRLAEPDAHAGYVLDGFPRNLRQAKTFLDVLTAVVALEISDDILINRLAGRLICPVCDATYQIETCPPIQQGRCDRDGTLLVRRPDDDPSAIRHRLEVYRRETEPLEEFYGSRNLLLRVDANGTPETVTGLIEAGLHRGV